VKANEWSSFQIRGVLYPATGLEREVKINGFWPGKVDAEYMSEIEHGSGTLLSGMLKGNSHSACPRVD
jgi:hypothetical protein